MKLTYNYIHKLVSLLRDSCGSTNKYFMDLYCNYLLRYLKNMRKLKYGEPRGQTTFKLYFSQNTR